MTARGPRLAAGLALALALAPVLVVVTPAPGRAQTVPPAVGSTYGARGPAGAAVTRTLVADGGTTTHRVYFPTDLGPPGARHPVVAWGNGSFEHPDKYEPLLRHLASWGCIVVAAETDQAGTGQELLAGARHVLAADLDPASALFGHVDHDHVAAVGHSQGAGGAMRAATDPSGIVTTVVAVALPAAVYQLLGTDHDFHATRLRVPALFLSGEADTLISPAGTVAGYYDEVPGAAAMGILRGADHNTIQLDAGSGFRGYVTAWLRWQLAGDATAGTAFTGPHPGLAADPAWADVRTKDLGAAPEPAPSPAAAPAPGPGPTAPTVAPPPGGPAASAPSAAAPSSEPPALPATGGGGVGPLVGVALAALALAARHPSWRHPGARPHAR